MAGSRVAERPERLAPGPGRAPGIPGSAFWGWAGPVLVMLFGGYLRFDRLSLPNTVVFDETYYVPDANSILHHGVELSHVAGVNKLLVAGDPNFYQRPGGHLVGEIVAHPPLGKIVMAAGQWMFGLTPFGWRFSVAVAGTLSILMLARIARRMTRSTLLGCAAGLLLALDGLELVLSRTAILDIFVMFWVLAAFGLLVLDRDRTIARLGAARAADDDGSAVGPRLGPRWERVAAGLCLGAACASKWSGVWFLLAFAGLGLAWDLGAWRAAGYRDWLGTALRRDALWLPVWYGIAPLLVYTASWTGWFATSDGYFRNWAASVGNHTPVWSTIDSWVHYNQWMLQFGLGLASKEPYQSNPLGWVVLARPTSMYSQCLPVHACGAAGSTEAEVLAIGTPLIWWGGTLALLFCLGWWLLGLIGDLALHRAPRRDWRPAAALVGVGAGWLPWIWYAWHDHRTEFYYYAVAFDPFLILAVTLCLGLVLGPARSAPARRPLGAVLAGGYLIAVLLNFAYLYPVLTGRVIPYSAWLSRMWFSRWI